MQFKKEWITALRSGQYKQATGTLCAHHGHEDYGFCCLGVLAEVIEPGVLKNNPNYSKGSSEDFEDHFEDEALSEAYCDAHGLGELYALKVDGQSSGGASLHNICMIQHLINMNDQGSTFEEIAKYVEEKIPDAT